jgi:membrane protein
VPGPHPLEFSPGAVVTTSVWLAASVGFSIYTANLPRYKRDLRRPWTPRWSWCLWLSIGACVAVAGAELNAELERQSPGTRPRGTPKSWGRRDAYAADTLGESLGR